MKLPLWFQIVWASLISGAVSYYLNRCCWRRGTITPPRPVRARTGDVSRDKEPGLDGWCMGMYAVFDLFFLVILVFRVYEMVKAA